MSSVFSMKNFKSLSQMSVDASALFQHRDTGIEDRRYCAEQNFRPVRMFTDYLREIFSPGFSGCCLEISKTVFKYFEWNIRGDLFSISPELSNRPA